MKEDWLSDARKIPDEVMNYLRRIAVRAVEEKHYSPELITAIFESAVVVFMSGCARITQRRRRFGHPKSAGFSTGHDFRD
ncbi:MAG: hypothetical protein IPL59_09815 [Candidatus Competibacteraceae bacterium]|nr:hypothetical protein [Candidatus Competibacteraceae bacterium]